MRELQYALYKVSDFLTKQMSLQEIFFTQTFMCLENSTGVQISKSFETEGRMRLWITKWTCKWSTLCPILRLDVISLSVDAADANYTASNHKTLCRDSIYNMHVLWQLT